MNGHADRCQKAYTNLACNLYAFIYSESTFLRFLDARTSTSVNQIASLTPGVERFSNTFDVANVYRELSCKSEYVKTRPSKANRFGYADYRDKLFTKSARVSSANSYLEIVRNSFFHRPDLVLNKSFFEIAAKTRVLKYIIRSRT